MFVKLHTLNKTEQFYKIIRPSAMFLKLFGFFPLQNISCGSGLRLAYDRTTAHIHLWITLLVYSAPSLYMIHSAPNAFTKLSEAALAAIFVLYIITCFRTDPCLLDLIHQFEKYDQLYIHSRYTVSHKRFRYRGFLMFVFIAFLVTFKATLIDYLLGKKRMVSNGDLIEFVWMECVQSAPWIVMFNGFYAQICSELSLRFHELRQCLVPPFQLRSLETIRLMHGRLKRINDTIHSCFGLRLSLFCLYFLHSFLHLFYKVVVASKRITPATLLAEVKKFLILYLTCYSSEFAVIQNKQLIQHLQSIPRNNMDSSCEFQLDLLTQEAEASSFAITAWGLFTVDREMYATMFVVVITYVITVLQIPPEYNRYLLQEA